MTKVESPSILTSSIGSIWTATFRPMGERSSVQLLAEILDQPRHLMALAVIVGNFQEALECLARGAELAEPRLDEAGLAVERCVLGRDQGHPFQHRSGALELAFLDQADLQVVLEPQQDVAVADRGVMLGLQLGLVAGCGFQLASELRGVARL